MRTKWPRSEAEQAARAARRPPDDELIAGYDEWLRGWPPHDGDDAARTAYADQYQAWLDEVGVGWTEVDALFHRRTMSYSRWMSEAKGREWGGLDVPAMRPPDPSLWECPSCGRVTFPYAGGVVSWLHGTATVCVPCGRARAGIFLESDEPYREGLTDG